MDSHDQAPRPLRSLAEAVSLLDEWIVYARELEAENLRVRKLAFTIWCRDFENLKARWREEQANRALSPD